jgi:hypothetical protein
VSPRPHARASQAAGRPRVRPVAAEIAALGVAALYAGLVSGARPFTVPADVFVSVPSALFVGALLLERLRPEKGPWRRLDRAAPEPRGTAIPWVLVLALLAAVELASYFHPGPRSDYPTLSSGLDALFRHRAVTAAGWFAWLTVGWYLVRR